MRQHPRKVLVAMYWREYSTPAPTLCAWRGRFRQALPLSARAEWSLSRFSALFDNLVFRTRR